MIYYEIDHIPPYPSPDIEIQEVNWWIGQRTRTRCKLSLKSQKQQVLKKKNNKIHTTPSSPRHFFMNLFYKYFFLISDIKTIGTINVHKKKIQYLGWFCFVLKMHNKLLKCVIQMTCAFYFPKVFPFPYYYIFFFYYFLCIVGIFQPTFFFISFIDMDI